MKYFHGIWLVIILSSIASCNFAPGSYPYAEKYVINISEPDLIEAIKQFKINNTRFIVPEQAQLLDGRKNEIDQNYWYHVYFYYEEENTIVKCWTRPFENGKTTLAFVGINQGLELGNWKMINKDFNRSENKIEKDKFEKRILSKIKAIL